MKEFLVGLLFLIAVVFFAGIGLLLFPLIIVLHLILRAILALAFMLACIWLLGKFIIFVWKKFKL